MDKLMEQLQAPFPAKDIEWRVQSSGKAGDRVWALIMPYVTNRAIQQRLDEVFGVAGWKNEFRPLITERATSFLCGISIRTENAEWVTKWDGADETDFENFKGGLSNSMKRSAVQYGIGRYLYRLEAKFVDLTTDKGEYMVRVKDDKTKYYYNSPALPSWALPEGEKPVNVSDKQLTNSKTKSEDKHDETLKGMGARNLTEEASNCQSLEALTLWFKSLDPATQKMAKAVATNRKEELNKALAQAQAQPATESKIPDFDAMKKLTIAGLYSVCMALDIEAEQYKSMKKADLINYLLKLKQEGR